MKSIKDIMNCSFVTVTEFNEEDGMLFIAMSLEKILFVRTVESAKPNSTIVGKEFFNDIMNPVNLPDKVAIKQFWR
jgi:hypothetical protein